MISKARIEVASRSVGEIAIDGAATRGEGGPHDPRLVLPLSISMSPRPLDQMLVLTEIARSLHLGQDATDQNQVGPTVSRSLLPQMHARSLPGYVSDHFVEIRIPLGHPAVAHLEAYRHRSPGANFRCQLRLTGGVAFVHQVAGSANAGDNVRPLVDNPFGLEYSILSTLAYFWVSSISPLTLEVPSSAWVERVLPGLGLEHVRLLEIGLPTTVAPLPAMILEQFDRARADLDAGRRRECIQKLRDVRHDIEKHLGATSASPVATLIAQHRGLQPNSAQEAYFGSVWKALADLTNATHTAHGRLVPRMHARRYSSRPFCWTMSARSSRLSGWPLQPGSSVRGRILPAAIPSQLNALGPGTGSLQAWKIPRLARIWGLKTACSELARTVFLLQRLLPSQVAIVRHPGESWLPTPISMFCLGWSRHDEWLRPILDEFQNELPVDDLEAARL